MIRLITNWYRSQDQTRRVEIKEALFRSVTDSEISEVVVLDQGGLDTELPYHCRVIPISSRPTFADLVSKADAKGTTVNVLINADCYIELGCAHLLESVQTAQVFCISRQDVPRSDSQDCWAWRGILPVSDRALDFYQGRLGCDNRFAAECQAAGLTCLNPCRSILVQHRHASNVRTGSGDETLAVSKPYAYVEPCFLP